MKKIAFAALTLFLTPLTVAGFGLSDIIWGISDYFDTTRVENTGLTVFPTLIIPMGGEYEAMGTAYTAVARDASFFDANPAASSRLQYTELTLMHNNLIADTNMESAVYTVRFGDLGLAVGGKFLHVPFTEYDIAGVQQSAVRYTETVAGLNVSYNFLNSFNFHGISAGTTLKAAYRHVPPVIAPGQSAVGVMADFGLLTRFNVLKFFPSRQKNFSAGLTARNIGPPVLDEPLPSSVVGGIAWAPINPMLLAFDLSMPIMPFSDDPPEPLGYAGGVAVQVTDFFAAQSGFLLRGGNPRITLGGRLDLSDIRFHVNYTLDMTTQTDRLDRFSVMAALNLGDGGRADFQRRVEEYYLDSLVAYAAGEFEATVALAERALELDPRFHPAAETRDTAARLLALQSRLDAIRFGEDLPPTEAAEPEPAEDQEQTTDRR
ncbi:MAG: hypothetical protein EA384_03690 [Spirochaetaceae bacterium]|nr:MAG: hypothetical protein EA384_03690 [Spirochaetaceae bacterium]